MNEMTKKAITTHIQEHQERVKEQSFVDAFKHWQGHKQAQVMTDAMGVLGGDSKVQNITCDQCEHGYVATRVRIVGPIHYWKRSPCKHCHGQGSYRIVTSHKGTRGHVVWGSPAVGIESQVYASGLAQSGPAKPMGFQPRAITSPSSQPPPGQPPQWLTTGGMQDQNS